MGHEIRVPQSRVKSDPITGEISRVPGYTSQNAATPIDSTPTITTAVGGNRRGADESDGRAARGRVALTSSAAAS